MSDDIQVTTIRDNAVEVRLNGDVFSYERGEHTTDVVALAAGETVEQLRSSVTADGRCIWVRDEAGATATYSTRTSGDLISTRIEVTGRSYQVEATVTEYRERLMDALRDVSLPNLQRIPRLAQQVRSNADLRTNLPGLGAGELATSLSSDCQVACAFALIPFSPGLQPFAAGYCAGCLLHG